MTVPVPHFVVEAVPHFRFRECFLESSITMYILFLIISLLQIVLVLDYVEIVLKRRFLPLNARVQHLRNFQLFVC